MPRNKRCRMRPVLSTTKTLSMVVMLVRAMAPQMYHAGRTRVRSRFEGIWPSI